jgi:hypothetical protein
LDELRVFTVFVVPESVTVLVLFVNVLPAPEVSQLPEAFHVPAPLKLIVPDVPPVMVTSVDVTAPVERLNVVPFPMVTVPSVNVEVEPVIPPVPTKDTTGLPVTLSPLVVSVPEPEVLRVLLMSTALVRSEIVPLIVSR